ncbi:hypothetical protein PtB15_11B82 [Puccinia triticina]|nr:hypothetical protein PtB15_11B82 [Puccinia triticina]
MVDGPPTPGRIPGRAGTTVDGYRLLRGRCQLEIRNLSTVHGSTPGRNDRAGTTIHDSEDQSY